MSTRRVLVTGSSGLIGGQVVRALLEAGYEVRTLQRTPTACAAAVEAVPGDVRDVGAVARAVRACDAVCHVAALYSYARADAAEMMSVNVAGTRVVLDQAARAGVRRVVLTSTSATCGPVPGRPADERDAPPAWELGVAYKRSKLAAERLALERALAGQDIVVVNPTTTVGPDDLRPTPSGRIVRDVLRGRIFGYIASGGLNVVAARDVARGHVLALRRGRSGERYILGGENVSMGRLFEMIASLGGVRAPRVAVPYRAALAAARVADASACVLGVESPLLLDEVRLARAPLYFDPSRAVRELGYTFLPAPAALAPAVEWFAARQAPTAMSLRSRWRPRSVGSFGSGRAG